MKQLQKISERICAIFLVALMMFQSLPLHVLAAEIPDEEVNISTNDVPEDDEGSKFTLVNSDVQISDEYLPETAYISEIENPGYDIELPEREYPEGLVLTKAVGDPMVYLTQRWLNQEYCDVPGFGSVPENGKTGWDTVYGLLRALQHELGITELANNFGPTTSSLYSKNLLYRQDGVTNRMFAILQGALWCKGYSPGYHLYENEDGTVSFDEVFDEKVERAIIELKQDAGLINPDGVVTVNVMKALMSMDSFKLLSYYGGDPKIREMQQALNREYEEYTGLTPCDGVYGRNTNTALIYALQCEEGLPTNVANGNFGVTTKLCCPNIPYAMNSSSAKRYPGSSSGKYYTSSQITAFTKLLQFSLYVNGFGDGIADGKWDSELQNAIRAFQAKYAIKQSGIADKATWMSLFVSSGDTDRSALAADCATILTKEKAQTLYNNGYRYIGRYLTGRLADGTSKAITREEAEIIFDAGLRFFPIFQTAGYYNSYFSKEQGEIDALSAIDAANKLGIPSGTIIYFAVDYDCMDYQVTSNVIPYFKKVSEEMADSGYKVGIYGTRNTCTRVSNLGYACSSFVGDMSTGFSGNLGFSLPNNWAFDQFKTVTIGSGSGRIEIDKNGYSGRDPGVHELESPNLTIPHLAPITPATDTLYGPTVSFERQGNPLFNFDIGFNLENFFNAEAIYDDQDHEFKIIYGCDLYSMSTEEYGTKSKVGKFNEAYREIKTMYSCCGKNKEEFTKRFNDFKGSLLQRGRRVGFDTNLYFFGFLTLDSQTSQIKEGGYMLVGDMGTSIKYPFPLVPTAYVKLAIDGSLETKVEAKLKGSNIVDLSGDISLDVTPSISAGIDFLKAHTYVGFMGTLNCNMKMPYQNSLEDFFSAELSASFFIDCYAYFWGWSHSWDFWKYQLYPPKKESAVPSTLSISQDDLEFIDPLPSALTLNDSDNPDTVSSNVQVYCAPQIISLGNGKMMMTYISDIQNRNAFNRTALMYSVYDGTSWSNPKPVYDDATPDFEPQICADGNGGAHIVWQNASKEFEEGVTLDEMCTAIELYYTHWNGQSFENTIAITDNSTCETAHKITASEDNICIVWQENSLNDTFALTGTNSINRRQFSSGRWSDIEILADGLAAVSSIDTAYDGTNNIVAFTATTDSTDITELELYYYDGSTLEQLTDDSVCDHFVVLDGSEVYWLTDDSLQTVSNGDVSTKRLLISGLDSSLSSFKVLHTTGDAEVVIWEQNGNGGRNFYASYYDEKTHSFGNAIPLSDDFGVVRGWDACIMPNDQIELVYCFAEKFDEFVDGKPYGQLDLIQKTANGFYDIQVNPISTYEGEIKPGQLIDLSTEIYNSGSLPVNEFTVNIINPKGEIIQTRTIDHTFGVGEYTQLEIPFELPMSIEKTNYTIQVYASNQIDTDLSNNESVVTIGSVDLSIEDIEEHRTDLGRELIVTVKNRGYEPISAAKLLFYKDGMEGTLLGTESIDELTYGEQTSYSFTISNSDIDSTISEASRSYYFLLETDAVEADYGNNDQVVYVYPDYSVDVTASSGGSVTGDGTYIKGATVTLLATPDFGYIFDGWYENGQKLYVIPEEYEITVDGNRTLEAHFKKNDLKITDLEVFGSLQSANKITFTATADGGVQPWEWEFYIKKGDDVIYSDTSATVNFFEWIPSESGDYTVSAYVTDATGKRMSYITTVTIS